jgi:hypothetical protein
LVRDADSRECLMRHLKKPSSLLLQLLRKAFRRM